MEQDWGSVDGVHSVNSVDGSGVHNWSSVDGMDGMDDWGGMHDWHWMGHDGAVAGVRGGHWSGDEAWSWGGNGESQNGGEDNLNSEKSPTNYRNDLVNEITVLLTNLNILLVGVFGSSMCETILILSVSESEFIVDVFIINNSPTCSKNSNL